MRLDVNSNFSAGRTNVIRLCSIKHKKNLVRYSYRHIVASIDPECILLDKYIDRNHQCCYSFHYHTLQLSDIHSHLEKETRGRH